MRRSTVYKNRTSLSHNLGVIALCYFSHLIVSQAYHNNYMYNRYQLETSMVDISQWGEIQSTKIHNSLLHKLEVIVLCYTWILSRAEHNTISDINLQLWTTVYLEVTIVSIDSLDFWNHREVGWVGGSGDPDPWPPPPPPGKL